MTTCHLTVIPPPLVASDGLKLTNEQNQNKTNQLSAISLEAGSQR